MYYFQQKKRKGMNRSKRLYSKSKTGTWYLELHTNLDTKPIRKHDRSYQRP